MITIEHRRELINMLGDIDAYCQGRITLRRIIQEVQVGLDAIAELRELWYDIHLQQSVLEQVYAEMADGLETSSESERQVTNALKAMKQRVQLALSTYRTVPAFTPGIVSADSRQALTRLLHVIESCQREEMDVVDVLGELELGLYALRHLPKPWLEDVTQQFELLNGEVSAVRKENGVSAVHPRIVNESLDAIAHQIEAALAE